MYGGGGIHPDVALAAEPDAPAWLERVREQGVALAWVGGYVEAHAASLASLDAFLRTPSLDAATLADFRAFAQRQGVPIPAGAEADARLQHELVPTVASAKWGEAGWYRSVALLDAEVNAAVRTFARAADVLRGMR